ncbi:hypothetical protein QQS21_001127 [Conoideocrella luteorostrata]|uniref:AAA+ ATPase domain-containing protein n=1 Tax=Conoideocrella luteorostrata TaxID=1105319 RepID=A0AAJ0D103_9HYPO|nr:hypothetical protein QQS21_001127 [Conoideocrella luteorostrata]
MPTLIIRATPSSALALRASLTTSQRAFHSVTRHYSTNGAGPGGKPIDGTVTEHENGDEYPAAIETTGGRTRSLTAGPLRRSQARRRTASALPPVKLSSSFLNDNVSVYSASKQPCLPDALVEDAMHDKISQLVVGQISSPMQTHQAIETYFSSALAVLLSRACELAIDFSRSLSDGQNLRQNQFEQIEKVVRVWDMILDSAWHIVDCIYPARKAEYLYKVRPFWWWNISKDVNCRTPKFQTDQILAHSTNMMDQLHHAGSLAFPLSHAVMDFPVDTLMAMQRALDRELQATPSKNFDSRTSKRPITILSMSGYGGQAIAEAIGRHLAFWNRADLIHLDAQDLSILVGDYLGLNWAYSRGAVSMMGFRAAELNGKLPREVQFSSRFNDEDDNGTETGVIGLRASAGSFEDEIQKIRQGDYDCFSKWESLKIDKILDHIIRAAELKRTPEAGPRRILLHLHDIVELSMTLEGSLLIGRLRVLVDAAWQQGMHIAIFGTSSCEEPSEEFQDAVKQFATTDWVITRHLEPERMDSRHMTKSQLTHSRFSLQKADYFFENIRNINRMIRTLHSDSHMSVLDPSSEDVRAILRSENPKSSILRDSILPIPEIYNLAFAFKALENTHKGSGPNALSERCAMGNLQQQQGEQFLDQVKMENQIESGERHHSHEEPKHDGRAATKLNEYEKRISSGQINRDNLRISFADVHAPHETISALKLLTSLALVRPDAFAYGVLAQDRIPGCLLYGPPGTGKTMLAKAVAKDSGANMLEISGATINDKWVGESEKLIRAVFTLAKCMQPCVVFIDEADSLLASRSMFGHRASHREHINQFLKEWDGMEETNAFIMVATNRPYDLDEAVLRRLPRKILVDLPLKKDRAAILQLLLKDECLDSSVSIEDLAERSPYYSGSDLKNVCIAAAMAAVEEENEAAFKHQDSEPYQYPKCRVLRSEHFESGLKQIPASISEDMASLKQIRKFDEEYGNRRGGRKKRPSVGFGVLGDKAMIDPNEAKIRP